MVDATTKKTFEKVTGSEIASRPYKGTQRNILAHETAHTLARILITEEHYDPYYYTWSPFFTYVYGKTPETFLKPDQEGDE